MKSACGFLWLITLSYYLFAVAGDTMRSDYRPVRVYNKTDPSIFFDGVLPFSYTDQDIPSYNERTRNPFREDRDPIERSWTYNYSELCELLQINPDYQPYGFELAVPDWADNESAREEFEEETESKNPFLWWTHSQAQAVFTVPKIPRDEELKFEVDPSCDLSADDWQELSKDLRKERNLLNPTRMETAKASKYSPVLKLYNAADPEKNLEFAHTGPEKHVNVIRLCSALGIRPDGLAVDDQEKKIHSGDEGEHDVGAYYIFRGIMGKALWKKDGYAVSGLQLLAENLAEGTVDVMAGVIKNKKTTVHGPYFFFAVFAMSGRSITQRYHCNANSDY